MPITWTRCIAPLIRVASMAPALIAVLGSAPRMAQAVPTFELSDTQSIELPFGRLSWAGQQVRADAPGETPALPYDAPALPLGEWIVELRRSAGAGAYRHRLMLELAAGFRVTQGASYRELRITRAGLAETMRVEASLAVGGRESPTLALAMGDRVYIEMYDVEDGSRLVLRVSTGADRESGLGEEPPRRAASGTLPCGNGGPCTGFVQVASGYDHSVALTADGEVRAWGFNLRGELGDGTTSPRRNPVVVQQVGGGGPLASIIAVAAGYYHTVALTAGGQVRAWGYNISGQLGDGTTTDRNLPGVVQQVGGSGPLTGITAVAAGQAHTLALTTAGELRAWGYNSSGQLGDGTTTDRDLPVVVQLPSGGGPLTGIIAVATGSVHTVALTTAGEVRAWGWNQNGQLGNGTISAAAHPLPIVVQQVGGGGALAGVAAIAAGVAHTVALTTAGEVRAWGANSLGQLGDGTTTVRSLPVVVQQAGGGGALAGVAAIAAGNSFTVALTAGSEVRSWGHNVAGQLGDGTTTNHDLPVVVQHVDGGGPLTEIAGIAAGWRTTVAWTVGGEARAWGRNQVGQLGDGSSDVNPIATCVGVPAGGPALPEFIQVAAGRLHTVALTAGGEIRAWGSNAAGQLGDGTTTDQSLPVVVQQVGGGGPLASIAAIAAGSEHTVAATTGGEVRAWGRNASGQLGDGTTTDRDLPVVTQQVGGGGPLSRVIAIAAGANHTVALTDSREARTWGLNSDGRLGDGTTTNRNLPVVVQQVGGGGVPLSDIAAVAAGDFHTVALTVGDEVRAWGGNSYGQLGDGTAADRNLPVVVRQVGGGGPLSGITAIAVGREHTVALTAGGEVRSWGANFGGQLGDGTTSQQFLPVVVQQVGGGGALSGIADVAAGWFHTVASTTGGEARAWGGNAYGQLGDGTTTDQTVPVVVLGVDGGGPLDGIASVAANEDQVVALTLGGEVRGWGRNDRGQLGDGHSNTNPLPLATLCLDGVVPGADLLRNDETTLLDRASPPFATIFTGTGANSLDLQGPNGLAEVGEGPTIPDEQNPGSEDDDDLYRTSTASPWLEPDPTLAADAQRPLVFYQLAGTSMPLMLVRGSVGIEARW